MSEFGGADVESLKMGIDSVFGDNGNIPLKDYTTKLVSATSDGANVNLGIYNGAITMMKADRPWLKTIHCANHRLELVLKDAVKEIRPFQDCDKMYLTMYFLFKNSGKLKSECRKAADALNITYYPLPKIHGTRFLNHRRRGFSKLLHDWPALITGFENLLANPNGGSSREPRAKVQGILAKLNSYDF